MIQSTRLIQMLLLIALSLSSGVQMRAQGTGERGAQEIYIWQRQWTPEVRAGVEAVRSQASAFHVLAAEIAWRAAQVGREGQADIFRANLDYAELAALGRPVGLALRVGPYAGTFARDDAAARQLCATATALLQAARAGGLAVSELQVDFDCAEAKLAGYREWLLALRAAVGSDTRLVFTALPVWLKHADEFAALARAADGYVLQVHSLEKPSSPDAPIVVCDPIRAIAWAKQAAGFGVPFRVALPTYGYEVAFDAAGRFIALAAEGPRPTWPAGTRTRIVRADAGEMLKLAQALAARQLSGCEGVIWFRMPVAGDRLNWDMRTLTAVMRGEQPREELATGVEWSQDEQGLVTIYIENTGEVILPYPREIAVAWESGVRAVGADGLGDFRLTLDARAEREGREGLALISTGSLPAIASIAPGRRVRLGWIRFTHEISLYVKPFSESK